MSKVLDNIYIWVLLVNSERVLLLAFLKYMLHSNCTQNCIFLYLLETKTLVLWRKIVQNLVYLFGPKNSTIDVRKTFIESYLIPSWITLLMLYSLVYDVRSYFKELILAWSA